MDDERANLVVAAITILAVVGLVAALVAIKMGA
jgi:hypothetical protein